MATLIMKAMPGKCDDETLNIHGPGFGWLLFTTRAGGYKILATRDGNSLMLAAFTCQHDIDDSRSYLYLVIDYLAICITLLVCNTDSGAAFSSGPHYKSKLSRGVNK